jgi:hypothetical protein
VRARSPPSPLPPRPQIGLFFPAIHPAPLLTGDAAVSHLKTTVVASVPTPLGSVNATLHSVLVEGLSALCKAKPATADAVRWLGEWLIENNPKHAGGVGADSVAFTDVPSGAGAAAGGGSGVVLSAPRLQVVFVIGGDDATTGLCRRLGAEFGYAHLVAAGSGSAAAVVSGLNDSIVRDGGRRFIVQGFPRTLEEAFHFEKTIAQPLFVLLDGGKVEGPVADLYSKVRFDGWAASLPVCPPARLPACRTRVPRPLLMSSPTPHTRADR